MKHGITTLLVVACLLACGEMLPPTRCGTPTAQTINVGESETVNVCFEDPEMGLLVYDVRSSDPLIVSVSGGPNVRIEALKPGEARITVTARDPDQLTASVSFNVTVPNREPRLRGTIEDREIEVGEFDTIDVTDYFNEPDGEDLTYTAESGSAEVVHVRTDEAMVTLNGVARGMSIITVTATDPGGLTATQSFEVTVPNQPPIVSAEIETQELHTGDSIRIDASMYFEDPDGDELEYEVMLSSAVITGIVSGSVVTLIGVAPGEGMVTIHARDPDGAEGAQSFEVMVPNRGPVVIESITNQEVFSGDSMTISLEHAFEDPDGEMLVYMASSPSDVVSSEVDGSTVTISGVRPGEAEIMVTASDPHGAEASQTFEVTVPNREPRLRGTIEDRETEVGEFDTIDVTDYFNEPDGEDLTYTTESGSAEVVHVRTDEAMVTLNGVARGMSIITVTATDPGGLTATQSFEVTVPNQPPIVSAEIETQELHTGDSIHIDASMYFEDPDGDELEYEVMLSSAVITGMVSGSVVTLIGVAPGEGMVTIHARDPDGAEGAQSFEVMVPNRGPVVIESITNQEVFSGDSMSISLEHAFEDPDGEMLVYMASSPSDVVSSEVDGSTVTISGVRPGEAEIMVTASDPHGAEASQTFEVTVPNRGPRAHGTIGPQETGIGKTVSVDAEMFFIEPDGEVLSYEAVSSSPAVARTMADGSSITISGLEPGEAIVTVTATDPQGEEAAQMFEVTVGNLPPEPRGMIETQEVEVGESIDLDVMEYFEEPDGELLTYMAESSKPDAIRVSMDGTVVTLTGVSRGSSDIEITAMDPHGAETVQVFVTQVPNEAPVLSRSLPDFTLRKREMVEVDLADHFTDAEGDALTYSVTSSHSVLEVAIEGSVLSIESKRSGTAEVEVMADDGFGGMTPGSIGVRILNHAPEARDAIEDIHILVNETRMIVADEHFSDPDGDELTYQARSSNPSSVTAMTDESTITITGVDLEREGATITVTADDSDGGTATQEFQVTVTDAFLFDDFEGADLDTVTWQNWDGRFDAGSPGVGPTEAFQEDGKLLVQLRDDSSDSRWDVAGVWASAATRNDDGHLVSQLDGWEVIVWVTLADSATTKIYIEPINRSVHEWYELFLRSGDRWTTLEHCSFAEFNGCDPERPYQELFDWEAGDSAEVRFVARDEVIMLFIDGREVYRDETPGGLIGNLGWINLQMDPDPYYELLAPKTPVMFNSIFIKGDMRNEGDMSRSRKAVSRPKHDKRR